MLAGGQFLPGIGQGYRFVVVLLGRLHPVLLVVKPACISPDMAAEERRNGVGGGSGPNRRPSARIWRRRSAGSEGGVTGWGDRGLNPEDATRTAGHRVLDPDGGSHGVFQQEDRDGLARDGAAGAG